MVAAWYFSTTTAFYVHSKKCNLNAQYNDRCILGSFQSVVFCETAHKALANFTQASAIVHNSFPKNTRAHLRWYSSGYTATTGGTPMFSFLKRGMAEDSHLLWVLLLKVKIFIKYHMKLLLHLLLWLRGSAIQGGQAPPKLLYRVIEKDGRDLKPL